MISKHCHKSLKIYPKLLIEYVGSINKLMFDLPMPNNAQQLERWAKKQD